MGAPIGNTNHTDGRVWRLAINRALEKRGKGDRMAALEELATVLVEQAGNGDLPALKEVGDRLDGKPQQAIVGEEGAQPIRHEFVWKSESP